MTTANNFVDYTHDPRFVASLGFTLNDIDNVINLLVPEESGRNEMKGWFKYNFNGYRFLQGNSIPTLFNPQLVLTHCAYFLRNGKLQTEQLLDAPLRPSQAFLKQFIIHRGVTTSLLNDLLAFQAVKCNLKKSFSCADLAGVTDSNLDAMLSFSYYTGVLTWSTDKLLKIPNKAIHSEFVMTLKEALAASTHPLQLQNGL
jgi:hypothetical protein